MQKTKNYNNYVRSLSLVGTTSCGKSTIGNLLSGSYVLPSGVQETTTSVIELRQSATCYIPTMSCIDINNNDKLCETRLKSHAETRAWIDNAMNFPGSTKILLQIGIPQTRRETQTFILGRVPISEALNLTQGLTIRDFPGFQYEKDRNRLKLIERHLENDDVILFIFNAEETDSIKEVQLLKALFNLLHQQGKNWQSILFVLNRKDAFSRDSEPQNALQQALKNRQTRIKKLINETWKSTPRKNDLTIIPLSAGFVLATEMLSWHNKTLTKYEREHFQNHIAKEGIALLSEKTRDSLPRSVKKWDFIHWNRVYREMYLSSGLADFINTLQVKLST
ncbi:MAG: dynamin family protein [Pseudomonadota bacterium]